MQFGATGNLVAGYNSNITIGAGSTFRYSSGTSLTLGTIATISGAGGVTIDGGKDFTMQSGGDSYSGPTLVSGSQTRLINGNVTGAISPNTAITVVGNGLGGGQLYLNVSGTYANNITISGIGFAEGDAQANFDGAIRLGAQTLSGTITLAGNSRIGTFAGSNTISGQITGGFGIDFYAMVSANNQVPTYTISNTNNNYTGNTTIYASQYGSNNPTGTGTTLKLGASNVIPDGASAGNVVFALNGTNSGNSTVTLDLNGFSDTINGLTVNAGTFATKITNSASGASVLAIGANDTTSSFSGTITDGGAGKTLAITKIGGGALTLSGANSYTGGTTVNGGTLLANNVSGSATGSGNVVVNSGGNLGGNGFIVSTGANGVTINDGGSIRGGTAGTYNTLTLGTNTTPTSLTLNSTTGAGLPSVGSTLTTEVLHSAGDGVNTLHSSSLIDLSAHASSFVNLGGSGTAALGTGTGNHININIVDTTTSLVATESYTIILAKAFQVNGSTSPTLTNFKLNGTQLSTVGDGVTPTSIDSGNFGSVGTSGIANVTVSNNAGFGPSQSWALLIDPTGQYLELSINPTASPEAHHILLICVVVLLAGYAVRRRFQLRGMQA